MGRMFLCILVSVVSVPLAAQPSATRSVTTERFEDYTRSHQRDHDQEREALTRARETTELRLAEMNNLRAQINVERGAYVTRAQYDVQMDRLNKLEQHQASMQSASFTWIAAIGLFFTVVQVALRFLPTQKKE